MSNQFPLEKILNVSATEYCASVGRELKDYELKGVHATYAGYKGKNMIDVFAEQVPINAEVVVNYQSQVASSAAWFIFLNRNKTEHAQGTALIPKK